MNLFKTLASKHNTSTKETKMNIDSPFEIKINSIHGEPINLLQFKGKHILIVNVASKCGFTSQYKELQKMYEMYKDTLQIIGVPCNQFGGQEPGTLEEINSFCQINYGVSFPLTEKIEVKGKNQHPLYTWLTNKTNNGVKSSEVKWNFQKYLIDPKGNLIDYFLTTTKPMSSKITKHLK
ncbi:glutathione peroxidase [Seonamhaeicola maritimus]|uniref:glutathione peroxidase n=1 Tax=Seonamhaeicola maritimus TaxID=2591822 RepID=UPI003CD0CE83